MLWGWLQERRKVGSYDYAGCLSVPRLLFIRDNRLVQVGTQSVGPTVLQRDCLAALCSLMCQQAAACVHEAGRTFRMQSSLWGWLPAASHFHPSHVDQLCDCRP